MELYVFFFSFSLEWIVLDVISIDVIILHMA